MAYLLCSSSCLLKLCNCTGVEATKFDFEHWNVNVVRKYWGLITAQLQYLAQPYYREIDLHQLAGFGLHDAGGRAKTVTFESFVAVARTFL